jgi:riboflavin biosynthesis pyrimidine reductase
MRPYIICHMGTSIDGRLHPSRFTRAAAGISQDVLRGHYERVHDNFEADGWIVGRKTMSEMAKGTERSVAAAPKLPRQAHVAKRDGRKLAVAIDPSGRAHYGKDNVGGDHVVAVLGEQVSDAYLANFAETGFPMSSRARQAMTCHLRWNSWPLLSAPENCCSKAAAGSMAHSSSTN